jgi:hypothetical protein
MLISYFLTLRLWRWRQYIPMKWRLTFTVLHGTISQKTKLFHIHRCENLEFEAVTKDSERQRATTHITGLEMVLTREVMALSSKQKLQRCSGHLLARLYTLMTSDPGSVATSSDEVESRRSSCMRHLYHTWGGGHNESGFRARRV